MNLQLSKNEELILKNIEEGIPLVSRPFLNIGTQTGLTESQVISEISELLQKKIIRRFGFVVRHRELGISSNAMCVWNVPDEQVLALGNKMKTYPFVTLCYSRKKSLPAWNFNLYCMIHGRNQDDVQSKIKTINEELNLFKFEKKILFSKRCFKQRGSTYFLENKIDRELLNELQNGIPIVERPFEKLAKSFGISEKMIVEKISTWLSDGSLSRFGPMLNVEKMGGVFILVAMKVPQDRFEEVTKTVNSFSEVAHNYEREHSLNMWFVIATSTEERATEVLDEIEKLTNLKTIRLPKEKEFFLELKFKI